MAETPLPPFGIEPYVDRAVRRIEGHLAQPRADAATPGEAFVVGVFGEWGSGKSTVLHAIGSRFDNEPKPPADGAPPTELTLRVDFNAWRFEREEHLLVPLLKTLQRTLDACVERLRQNERAARAARGPLDKSAWAWFGRRVVSEATDSSNWAWLGERATLLGACTIALTRMVKLKAGLPGLGEVELNPADALKAMQEQVDRAAKLRAGAGADSPPLESLYYDLFGQLQRLTRGGGPSGSGRLNIVFLIDDLDRCLPEKAVEMLEAIKLFLDVDGCAFVLALDDEVIERGIAHRYRDYLKRPDAPAGARSRVQTPPITGNEYLEKIVQLPFRLPRWSKREVREFVGSRFADTLEPWTGAPMDPLVGMPVPTTPDHWLVDLIVDGVPPVPRNLVRAIELLDFTRWVALDRKLGQRLQAYPLAQMVLLQLFAPQCFRFLRRGHAEGWKTFERWLRRSKNDERDQRQFADAPDEVRAELERQPSRLDDGFFDWWVQLCRTRMRQPDADPYIGQTELPLALLLEEARHNRNGFDPRDLFLHARESVEVDPALEPYFSLFSDPASGSAAPAEAPVAAKPAAPAVAVRAPVAAAPVVVAPPAAETAVAATAAPRDREAFVRQLLSRSPDAWRNAISREEQLGGRLLDDATVDALLAQAGDFEREVGWLEVLAPLLSELQLRRLLEKTHCLRHWARAAGLIDGAAPAVPASEVA